jgi:hypothetical protein
MFFSVTHLLLLDSYYPALVRVFLAPPWHTSFTMPYATTLVGVIGHRQLISRSPCIQLFVLLHGFTIMSLHGVLVSISLRVQAMDEQEALQEFMDHLSPSSHFAGIRDCVCEALKQPRGSALPTFTSIADDVLDADQDFRFRFALLVPISQLRCPPPRLLFLQRHCPPRLLCTLPFRQSVYPPGTRTMVLSTRAIPLPKHIQDLKSNYLLILLSMILLQATLHLLMWHFQ